MDANIIAEATKFGAGILIAVIVFAAYQQLVNKITDVVRMNAEALTELRRSVEASCLALAVHEERTQISRTEVARVVDQGERIEQKVDRLLDRAGVSSTVRKTGN